MLHLALSCLAAIAAGFTNAWMWGKYIKRVSDAASPRHAALWDAAILSTSAITSQLWAWAGNHPLVLLSNLIGSASGTFTVLTIERRRKI